MLGRFLLILNILVFLVVPIVSAQPQSAISSADPADREPHWAKTLESIKSDVDRIIRENNALQVEYNTLKERILDVQTSIDAHKLENQKIEQDIARTQRLISQEQLTRDAMAQKLERLTQEGLTSQAKIDALKDQLATYDEKMRLWTLQINDLELEKKQLDLELQAQEDLQRALESGQADEVARMREKIAAAQTQTAQEQQAADGEQAQNRQAKEEVDQLIAENKALEDKIAELQQQKAAQLVVNDEWRRKNAQQGMPAEYAQKMKEKKALESDIVKLEAQLDEVKRSVEQSLEVQNKRRGLLDQILSLDKENRELRKKISDLKAKMATAAPDPAPANP